LQFATGKMRYKFLPFDAAFHQYVFGKMTRLSGILRSIAPPRTLSEYRDVIMAATTLAHNVAGKEYARSYGWKWLVRSYILTEMYAANVRRLQVSESNTLRDLQVSFPDQSSWLTMLQRGARTSGTAKLRPLLRELLYKDPVEMLTCDLCIFLGKEACKFPLDSVVASKKDIMRMAGELRRNDDQQASPLAVMRGALVGK